MDSSQASLKELQIEDAAENQLTLRRHSRGELEDISSERKTIKPYDQSKSARLP